MNKTWKQTEVQLPSVQYEKGEAEEYRQHIEFPKCFLGEWMVPRAVSLQS